MTDWKSCLMMLRDLRGYILHRVTGRRCWWGVCWRGLLYFWERNHQCVERYMRTLCSLCLFFCFSHRLLPPSITCFSGPWRPPIYGAPQGLCVMGQWFMVFAQLAWFLKNHGQFTQAAKLLTLVFFYVHVFISQVQSPDSHRTWRGSLTALIDLQADK